MTASLVIANFQTTLTTPDGRRHNIVGIPADGDWDRDHIGYLRNAADRYLTGAGYTRTGEWGYEPSQDAHTAPIEEV